MSERRRLIKYSQKEMVWVQMSSGFPKTVPIYAVGAKKITGSNQTYCMLGFSYAAGLSSSKSNSRILFNGYRAGENSVADSFKFYYNGSATTTKNIYYDTADVNMTKQTITLMNGTNVSDVWVYDNMRNPSSYDTYGKGPVYFNFSEGSTPYSFFYCLVGKDEYLNVIS